MIEPFISFIPNKNDKYIIFDIGSRDGLQSIEFYNHFPNSKIYAFECNPNTIDICRKNIINYSDRITLIECAICDYDGTISFYPINQDKTITTWTDGNPGASSLFKSNGKYPHETYIQDEIIIGCKRLDTLMKIYNIPNVDIIWMDLQGAELLALKGLGNYLNSVQYIYTEVSYQEIYTGQVLYDEFNNFMKLNQFVIQHQFNSSNWQGDILYVKDINHSIDLIHYQHNIYSQRGHDGIIEKIMSILDIQKGFFIEFGAYDGIHLSNCKHLFDQGWNGCFIEADNTKYLDLMNNYKHTSILCLNEHVYPTSLEGETIDTLYSKYMNHIEIDLLSIDIDGRDYEILEHLSLKPKLIIIEGGFLFHPCLKTKIPYDEAKDNVQQPLYILFQLAKEKGYQPICFNQDTFLLRNDLYEKYNFFKMINNHPIHLWLNAYNHIFNHDEKLWLNQHRYNHPIVNQYEHPYYLDLLHSISNVFDIVICVGPNDIDIIESQIEHTKTNIIGYRNIYLICSDSSISIKDCITIDESIFPFTINTVSNFHGTSNRNGWYLQQLLKLYAGCVIPNILHRYLVIDADTFFLKPTTFIENNKCLYNYGSEYHEPYFIHMNKLHESLIRIHQDKSGICHHMMFETTHIKEIFDMVENKHHDLFYNVFLKLIPNMNGAEASEYEIYFNYMLQYHPNEMGLRKLHWENTGNFNSLYDYISYHWHSRLS